MAFRNKRTAKSAPVKSRPGPLMAGVLSVIGVCALALVLTAGYRLQHPVARPEPMPTKTSTHPPQHTLPPITAVNLVANTSTNAPEEDLSDIEKSPAHVNQGTDLLAEG